MIASLGWKEYREHRLVWLVTALATNILVAGLALIRVPLGMSAVNEVRHWHLMLVALGMAATYGLVCGSMMLAGEKESDNLPFLDTWPAGRLAVWRTKVLFGALFAVAQGALLMAAAKMLGLTMGVLPLGW